MIKWIINLIKIFNGGYDMIQLAIFNNKGGVGKTTYLFHIANLLADNGICTMMVDCDSQCNLTAYAMDDNQIKKKLGGKWQ